MKQHAAANITTGIAWARQQVVLGVLHGAGKRLLCAEQGLVLLWRYDKHRACLGVLQPRLARSARADHRHTRGKEVAEQREVSGQRVEQAGKELCRVAVAVRVALALAALEA